MVPPLGTPSPDEVVNVLQPLIITAMTKYFDAYLQTRDGNVRNRLDATHDEVKAFVNYVVDLRVPADDPSQQTAIRNEVLRRELAIYRQIQQLLQLARSELDSTNR